MSLLLALATAVSAGLPNTRLVALEPDLAFPPRGQAIVREFGGINPKIPFREMVASWNVAPADAAALQLQVRARGQGFDTKWYTMARWSLEGRLAPRASVGGQDDANGTVDTDTLILKNPAKTLDARVILTTLTGGEQPRLKLLTFSFCSGQEAGETQTRASPAWGKIIDVPQRAQNNYPNGSVLCSATSLSMVLGHYSNQLARPELNKDVPEVEAHVWDPVYHGAGNWPLNTAYAGSFPGMRAYVARLGAVSDLEQWIAAGFPVICAVSFDILRGLPLSRTESGHLVVLVGFTKNGEPVINDPAFQQQVRRIYKRSDFQKAWNHSKQTVYLIYPENAKVPKDTDQLWISPR
jgi:hypothetical protein